MIIRTTKRLHGKALLENTEHATEGNVALQGIQRDGGGSIAPVVAISDTGLSVQWSDGSETLFHSIWLRERCLDPETLDARTHQRLIDVAALPLTLRVVGAALAPDAVDLSFDDGHRARIPLAILENARLDQAPLKRPITLWDASIGSPPVIDLEALGSGDEALCRALQTLDRFGMLLVRNVPVEMEGLSDFSERIGPLRTTNWGMIADVRSVADAFDLTMTTRGLEPHTDNPYRDPIPGYIFLHCLHNEVEGGESTLADGFAIADRIRREDADAFSALTRVRPRFRYDDGEAILESEGSLIELDRWDDVRRVRYSNRSEWVDNDTPEALSQYYRARQLYAGYATSDEHTIRFKLGPGDMIVMDNYRLLHGRTPFVQTQGIRHLRQGYMERDVLQNRLATLSRAVDGV